MENSTRYLVTSMRQTWFLIGERGLPTLRRRWGSIWGGIPPPRRRQEFRGGGGLDPPRGGGGEDLSGRERYTSPRSGGWHRGVYHPLPLETNVRPASRRMVQSWGSVPPHRGCSPFVGLGFGGPTPAAAAAAVHPTLDSMSLRGVLPCG